jgi:putative exporter of polyketide antibiotics
MKIAKPMLLILTPIGVIGGLYEAYKFGSGLAFLMLALLTLIGVAMTTVVMTIRRERREEEERKRRDATPSE